MAHIYPHRVRSRDTYAPCILSPGVAARLPIANSLTTILIIVAIRPGPTSLLLLFVSDRIGLIGVNMG